MTTTTNQFRIEFLSVTAFGDKKCSSQWFETMEEALNSKWYNEKNAVIIEREKPKHPSFADRKNKTTCN